MTVPDLPSLWSSVVSAASSNPEVVVPSPRKWTDDRLKQAKKIHEYLDGNWEPLLEAVRTATTWGAPCRLDLSLERLTPRGCERLDSLLSGKWRREENRVSPEAALEAKEREIKERIDGSLKAYGRYSDGLDEELRQVRRSLAAVRGRSGT